ncbi:MAG: hypothetical protein KGI37_07605 [Alphaproteobacteria bacterium]|nr:hypothetical protein [Alphaproteobacteria bacterium]
MNPTASLSILIKREFDNDTPAPLRVGVFEFRTALRWLGDFLGALFILGGVVWGPWLYYALTGHPMSFGG